MNICNAKHGCWDAVGKYLLLILICGRMIIRFEQQARYRLDHREKQALST